MPATVVFSLLLGSQLDDGPGTNHSDRGCRDGKRVAGSAAACGVTAVSFGSVDG